MFLATHEVLGNPIKLVTFVIHILQYIHCIVLSYIHTYMYCHTYTSFSYLFYYMCYFCVLIWHLREETRNSQLIHQKKISKLSSNLNLSLVSEQHNYATRSASLQHLNPESFRINIRKFCPTILGCYYWNDIPLSIRNQPTRKLFKKALHQYYFAQY